MVFEISLEDFTQLVEKCCYYCGLPPRQKIRKFTYNGLDRMNSDQGYFTSNLVPCCKSCNQMKSNRLTPEETQVVGRALRRFRERVFKLPSEGE